ncbi:exporter of the RND superfamily protein-like [Hymenobacter roseosalivarius DSM 11622]|uniref:Exporter of the RND superfamily protein-like n=1 Tax=Hymenobacter roseosalivarius DSM 11622 TaxID=645990 RepID=A0A1W1W0J5_9BACT|nr:MMPL family transporter [Hymenobacter roseosalivarius]SMB99118.1 exporter of the RND superfamily protein-like [Hymenobacter roseosalivarius DSM 11622]
MPLRKLSYLTLLVLALVSALSVYYVAQLRFNYNFNDFYPAGDPDLDYYEQYSKRFGNDNDYVLIGLEAPAGGTVFNAPFLARVDSFTRFVQRQRYVEQVTSPTTLTNPIVEGLGVFNIPYLHLDEPARLPADSAIIYQTPGLVGNLFATNGRAVTVILQTAPDLKKPPGDSLMTSLTTKLTQLGFAPSDYHIAGKLVAQSVFVDRLQREMILFMSLSVLLVTGLLWFTFRTWWGVVLPLVVVLGAILWGLGLMSACGVSIDLMTALLPVIMFTVGMSDTIHFITRYVTELGYGATKNDALRTTIRESGFGSGLSALTTSIGFFTLMTSSIRPIHNFGLFTGISVLLAFVLTFTLLPALLLLLRKPQLRVPRQHGHDWDGVLGRLFRWVLVRRRLVFGLGGLLIAGSIALAMQVRINSALLDDLSEGDPVRQDFGFFERHFAGVRPFELDLKPANGGTIYDLAVLRQIERVETYLRQEVGLNFVASPVTIIKSVRKALNGGDVAEYRLPESEAELRRIVAKVRLFRKKQEFRSLVQPDAREGRLTGRMPDVGSIRADAANARLRTFLTQNIDASILQTRLTGSANLIDKNNQNLTRDMIVGMSIDVVMVTLIVLALFRSLRMTAVVLVPNLVPIIVVAGVMGLAGVSMKVSTSIIFTIAFGIAVDDTIHFISKLKLTLLKEPTLFLAVRRTYLMAGKAVIVTSLILVGGFSTLLFSSFDGTFYVGLLIGLTLLFGVIAELTLLPLLILYFYKHKPREIRQPVAALGAN